MLVLFETAAGFGVFKVLDNSKLSKADKIWDEFSNPTDIQEKLQLVSFKKFKSVNEALKASTCVEEGTIGKTLRKLLKSTASEAEELAVGDTKLAGLIKASENLNIQCVHDKVTGELMRAIRANVDNLLAEHKGELDSMRLALAHSLGRYKVKFNPEKIDTMIVQAVSLLDDLDKELNNYVMRCREWYGWHFPELGKVLQDPLAFAKVVKAIGMKQNAVKTDLSDILPEELESRVKEEAELSMGTDISELDLIHVSQLCDQIIELTAYRTQLNDYLKNRMNALAPNLTVLLGELVGARLISKAGTLVTLAKYPASTVQILGAEKALFRALKTKRETPKYGLIYHAQLVGQVPAVLKGKIARKLAAKVSLSARVDALCDENLGNQMGIEARANLEHAIKIESEREPKRMAGGKPQYGNQRQSGQFKFKSEVHNYDAGLDANVKAKKRPTEATTPPVKAKKAKKDKSAQEEDFEEDVKQEPMEADEDDEE
ncbi:SnoRNA binding domain protein [Aphelenchoides fujianensis]|nr:SnoRNA binding domain protein [Aphelenchoides fujianensis]